MGAAALVIVLNGLQRGRRSMAPEGVDFLEQPRLARALAASTGPALDGAGRAAPLPAAWLARRSFNGAGARWRRKVTL